MKRFAFKKVMIVVPVDHELPSITEAKDWSGNHPNNDYRNSHCKGSWPTTEA